MGGKVRLAHRDLGLGARFGPDLQALVRHIQPIAQSRAPRKLLGQQPEIILAGAVGRLGTPQQVRDFGLQPIDRLPRPLIPLGAVFSRIGRNRLFFKIKHYILGYLIVR